MTSGKLDKDMTEMCENAVSEVAGSVGYFHGSSIVQMPNAQPCDPAPNMPGPHGQAGPLVLYLMPHTIAVAGQTGPRVSSS